MNDKKNNRYELVLCGLLSLQLLYLRRGYSFASLRPHPCDPLAAKSPLNFNSAVVPPLQHTCCGAWSFIIITVVEYLSNILICLMIIVWAVVVLNYRL